MFEMKMFEILKTPKGGLTLLMLTFFVYVTAPIFEWIYLDNLSASGKLPVNADSIGLPFGLFIIVWVLGIPFVSAFTFWVLWKIRHRFHCSALIQNVRFGVLFGRSFLHFYPLTVWLWFL